MTTDSNKVNQKVPQVQEDLSSIIETLLYLGVQVHDFQSTQDAKVGLSNHINKLLSQLQNLNKKDTSNILIPSDILQYIQDGRNPDIYTREFIEVVRKLNQFNNGKSQAFSKFHEILSSSIKQEFPELTTDIDKIIN